MKKVKKKTRRGRRKKDREKIPLPSLSEWQIQLLRDHLDNKRHLWYPLLVQLDDFFSSRTDLTYYLYETLGIPYFTRKTLDRLLPPKTSKLRKHFKDLSKEEEALFSLLDSFYTNDPDFLEKLYSWLREKHNRLSQYRKEPLGTLQEKDLDSLESSLVEKWREDYQGQERIEDTLRDLGWYEKWKQERKKRKTTLFSLVFPSPLV